MVLLKKIRSLGDFILFTSLFLASISWAALYESFESMQLDTSLLGWFGPFVFFATLSSYNFHWWLTPLSKMEAERTSWGEKHRHWNLTLCIAGLLFSMILFWPHRQYWIEALPAAIFTFLYSAPKIPLRPFTLLRLLSIGKTIYLAAVWTYVTVLMPAIISSQDLRLSIHFIIQKFFFLLALCILFDKRDKDKDELDGIRSLATILAPSVLDLFFKISILVSALAAIIDPGRKHYAAAIVPLMILMFASWQLNRKKRSDYYYYGLLDGLMGLGGLLLFCQKIL